MSHTVSVGAVTADYWMYAAAAMASFLETAVKSKRLGDNQPPQNVIADCREFLNSALAAVGASSANPYASIANYRTATDALFESRKSAPTERAEVDDSLQKFSDFLSRIGRERVLSGADLATAKELKAFFERLASDGSRRIYAESTLFEPQRIRFS